ncbi:hypothetical protein M9Y10_010811 [Tritrichomonas musculus]|uniref:Protein kinase domain-containing protein n=1 Tax=Tritrichomonas musculus TaxID=1915356 RepID=A0ABR2ILQ3_9EUKA
MGALLSLASQKSIIDLINEQQKLFFISNEIVITSRNYLFVAFRRIFDSTKKQLLDNKKCFALKLIKFQSESNIKNFEREMKVLDQLSEFPQIIKYEDKIKVVLNGINYLLLSMKYYSHTDLFTYLWKEVNDFDEDIIKKIAFQSLKILILLKSRNVVHNDFKFENFIIETTDPFKIILTDFESSQIIQPNGKSEIYTGTPIYKAPEVLRKEPHDYAADIWSLGANLYTTVFGKYPFQIVIGDTDEIIQQKIQNNPLENIDGIASEDCWECITKMLILDQNERITAEDALHLKWFENE